MKKSFNLDSEALKIIYKQYKGYLLPAGLVLVSLLLFFYLIIPQIAGFTDLQKQMEIENQKLAAINSNLNYLSGVDTNSLNSNFNTVNLVLPKEKDFVGIMGAVAQAAGNASVSLGDYELKVGDLAVTGTNLKGFPYLEIDLRITGDSSDLIRFMEELQKTAPISETISGGTSGSSSSLTVRFYYESLPPVSLASDTTIKPISSDNDSLLRSLLSWGNLERTVPIVAQGTVSGELNSSGPFQ